MKNLFCYFLLLFSCSIHLSHAQGDYFAPIGAEWHYGSTNQYNYPHYSRYWVEKDTIVVGVNCRKIVGNYVPIDSAARPLDDIYVYSTPDTVFYYNHSFKRFTPLYIFNLEVGDTIIYNSPYVSYPPHMKFQPQTPPNDSVFKVWVEKKEAIDIDNITLKKVTIMGSSFFFGWKDKGGGYTERIGSPFFMIPYVPGAYLPESLGISLRCYTDNEINFQTPAPCDVFFPEQNSIDQQQYPNNNISIYPNPTKGNFTIKPTSPFSQPLTATIIDLTGRTIKEFTIPSQQKEQDYSFNLPPGIYIVQCAGKDHIHTQKLIVEH